MTSLPPADDDLLLRADGVRLQILLRALPGQRHDVLGPLSVMRMGLALLKRRLKAEPLDPAALQTRVADLEGQIDQTVAAVALMRGWDADHQASLPLAALLQQCCDLLRTDASLRGHRLLGPELEGAAASAGVALPDGLFAVLGLLLHAVDSAGGPTLLTVRQRGDSVLLCRAPRADGPRSELPMTQRPLQRASLDLLLRSTGWCCVDAADGALLLQPSGTPPPAAT